MSDQPISTFTFDPPLGDDIDIQDVCTWMIRVMDKKDKSVVFVASVLTFFLKQGGVSEKQYHALYRVYERVLDAFNRNALEVQGSVTVDEDGTPANIVSFKRPRSA